MKLKQSITVFSFIAVIILLAVTIFAGVQIKENEKITLVTVKDGNSKSKIKTTTINQTNGESQNNPPTDCEDELDTRCWKTFINPNYDYTIKYPPNWFYYTNYDVNNKFVFDENKSDTLIFAINTVKNSEGHGFSYVNIEKNTKLSSTLNGIENEIQKDKQCIVFNDDISAVESLVRECPRSLIVTEYYFQNIESQYKISILAGARDIGQLMARSFLLNK